MSHTLHFTMFNDGCYPLWIWRACVRGARAYTESRIAEPLCISIPRHYSAPIYLSDFLMSRWANLLLLLFSLLLGWRRLAGLLEVITTISSAEINNWVQRLLILRILDLRVKRASSVALAL